MTLFLLKTKTEEYSWSLGWSADSEDWAACDPHHLLCNRAKHKVSPAGKAFFSTRRAGSLKSVGQIILLIGNIDLHSSGSHSQYGCRPRLVATGINQHWGVDATSMPQACGTT